MTHLEEDRPAIARPILMSAVAPRGYCADCIYIMLADGELLMVRNMPEKPEWTSLGNVADAKKEE